MARTVPMIGIETAELRWIRLLVSLLRHPDPHVPELTRQAILYLIEEAGRRGVRETGNPFEQSKNTFLATP